VSSVKQRHEEEEDEIMRTIRAWDSALEKRRVVRPSSGVQQSSQSRNKNCCEKKRVVVGVAIHGIQLTNTLIP
jgi:hypothetical protein